MTTTTKELIEKIMEEIENYDREKKMREQKLD